MRKSITLMNIPTGAALSYTLSPMCRLRGSIDVNLLTVDKAYEVYSPRWRWIPDWLLWLPFLRSASRYEIEVNAPLPDHGSFVVN